MEVIWAIWLLILSQVAVEKLDSIIHQVEDDKDIRDINFTMYHYIFHHGMFYGEFVHMYYS